MLYDAVLWTAKYNTLKTQFWACEPFFPFFSIDYCTESFVLFYLLNIERNFVLWKVAKPGTLRYEKPICIKTSRNKSKSKSWKQLNNNMILEWQSKWKHSVKNCWFLYTAKNLNHFPVIDDFQCEINQIIWIAKNFQKSQRKGVFSKDLIVYLVFISSIWCF